MTIKTILIIGLLTTLLTVCKPAPPPINTAESPTSNETIQTINGIPTWTKTVGKGAPIILLHGGPGFDHNHLSQMNALADRYQLIYYDQRGSGNSSGEVNASTITMQNFVQDLEAMRQQLKLEKMDLIGASFGGLIVMYYGIQHPERLNSLILIGSVPAALSDFNSVGITIEQRTDKADKKLLEQIAASAEYANKDTGAQQRYFRILFKSYLHNPELASKIDLTFGKNTLANMNTINELMYQNLGDFNIYTQLPRIHCPTLILHGDEDPFPYQAAEKIQKEIPNSEIVRFQQTGHFIYLENPDPMFTAIRNFYLKHLN